MITSVMAANGAQPLVVSAQVTNEQTNKKCFGRPKTVALDGQKIWGTSKTCFGQHSLPCAWITQESHVKRLL